MRAPRPVTSPEVTAYEQWFQAAGVPAFIKGYASVRSVLGRWYVVLATALVIAVIALGTALLIGWNRLDSDAAIDALFGLHPLDLVIIGVPSLLLGWWLTAIGFGTVSVFAVRWFFAQLVLGQSRVFSVLPLVIAAQMFLIYSTETWATIGSLSGTPFSLVLLLFVALIVMFLLRRGIRGDIVDARVRGFDDLVRSLPDGLPTPSRDGLINNPKLSRTEVTNIVVVMVLGKVLVAAGLGLLVGVFFLTLSVLSINLHTVTEWIGSAPTVWWSFDIAGTAYAMTASHARMAAFLGLFAAFYFVVSSTADAALNREANEATERHVRRALAARSAYRQWRHAAPGITGSAAEYSPVTRAEVIAEASEEHPRRTRRERPDS